MNRRQRAWWAARSGALLVLVAIPALGCRHAFVNERLEQAAPESGYRYDTLATGTANTDSLCVCLAFSGGGYRAAALACGVLETLRDTPVVWGGEKKRLLDEVDCISAVSGGAFPATYYGLFGDRIFEDFQSKFFDRNLGHEVEAKVLSNAWWLWADHHLKRSDLVGELYGDSLFEGTTFAALEARPRPLVVVNATDMTNGQRFEFTQDQFDLIGSQVTSFPIGRAVAASSAFPFLLSTITLRNHARLEGRPAGFVLPPGIQEALDAGEDDPRLAAWARSQALYSDPVGPSFLHLTDGGVSDNTGVRALWTALRRGDGFLGRRVADGRIRRLVVIVVNARNDPLRGLGDTESSPSVATVVEKTARIGVNNASFETIRWLQEDPELKARLARAHVEATFVEVSFEALPDAERRERLMALPTNLWLEPADVAAVKAAGREILERSPRFQRLVKELE